MMKKTRIESPHIVRSDDPARHFLVPEDYFDTLAEDLLHRIKAEERAETKLQESRSSEHRPWYRRRAVLGAAAAVVAILLAIPLVYNYLPLSFLQEQIALSEPSREEPVEMTDEEYEDFLMEDMEEENYYRVVYSSL